MSVYVRPSNQLIEKTNVDWKRYTAPSTGWLTALYPKNDQSDSDSTDVARPVYTFQVLCHHVLHLKSQVLSLTASRLDTQIH
jgi:hypothetical protein